jgi:hypothetical protein
MYLRNLSKEQRGGCLGSLIRASASSGRARRSGYITGHAIGYSTRCRASRLLH